MAATVGIARALALSQIKSAGPGGRPAPQIDDQMSRRAVAAL